MNKAGAADAIRKRLGGLRHKASKTATQVGSNPHREFGTKKAIVYAVAGGAVAGWLSLPMACTSVKSAALGNAAVATASADPAVTVAEQVRATSAAEAFLWQWMTADKKTASKLASVLMTPPAALKLPDKAPAPPHAINLTTVSNPSQGVWLVTFQVAGGASGKGESYQVPVTVEGPQTGILALPSRVSDPISLEQESADTTPLNVTHPAAQTAVGFLKSWLTNAGDINRWTTTGFTPAPVESQTCSQVVLTEATTSLDDEKTLTALRNTTTQSPTPTPGTATAQPAASQDTPASDPVGITATVSCTTGSATRLLTYQLQLQPVAGQLAVSAVNPYS